MIEISSVENLDVVDEYKAEEKVNHPNHYNRLGAMECLDEMEWVFGTSSVMTFCLMNCWKYRYRAADKGGEEDLAKSDFYMNKYVELKKKTTEQ